MAGMNDILTMDRLPAMPSSLARVLPLLLDPESSLDAIERVVKQDEALTVAVLRLANSVKYGVPGKQFDLKRSMSRLGRDALRRCVLEQQVSGVVSSGNEAYGLQRGALWRAAVGGAIAAEELARAHAPEEASLAFVCGLLRDVGKLAIGVKYDGTYAADVASHQSAGLTFAEAERATFGFDHAQLGGALAKKWKLPDRIVRAVELHHAPPGPGPDHDIVIDLVHAGDVICLWAGLGVGNDGLTYRLAEHVREELSLDRRSAESAIALVWEKLREAEEAMGGASSKGVAA